MAPMWRCNKTIAADDEESEREKNVNNTVEQLEGQQQLQHNEV